MTTLNAVAATISSATRGAVVGRIVPPHMISRATALNGISFGAMLTVGPAVAGVLAASVGLPWTFAADAVLFTAGFIGIWTLPALPRLGEKVEAGWGVLTEGLRFLRTAPNIRMSFIVDIVAMTFGRPYVLFPALGATVVGGGSLTVGALTAAGAAGTILTSLFSGPVARVHRHGLAIARAITVFGGFVALFGVVTLAMGASRPRGRARVGRHSLGGADPARHRARGHGRLRRGQRDLPPIHDHPGRARRDARQAAGRLHRGGHGRPAHRRHVCRALCPRGRARGARRCLGA